MRKRISAVFAVVVLVLLFYPFSLSGLWWHELFNSGHIVLFALLSFSSCRVLKSKAKFTNVFVRFFIVFLAGVLLGVIVEALQSLAQRDTSANDLLADALGVLVGFGFVAVVELKSSRNVPLTIFFTLSATSLLLFALAPLIQLSWHYVERNRAFPVIMDLSANWSESFVRYNLAVLIMDGSLSNDDGGLPVVQLDPGQYPGISVIEPVADWTAYSRLRLSIYSKNESDFELVLRVHDYAHNQSVSDRYNKRLSVHAGLNEYSFPVDNIRNGAVNRKLDMTRVAGVTLFSMRQSQPLQLMVGDLYLE